MSSRRRQGEAHPKLLPQPWIVHANVDTVEVDVEAMCVEVEAKGVDAKAVEAVPGKRAIPVAARVSCGTLGRSRWMRSGSLSEGSDVVRRSADGGAWMYWSSRIWWSLHERRWGVSSTFAHGIAEKNSPRLEDVLELVAQPLQPPAE